MIGASDIVISCAVEGPIDEAVLRRLTAEVGVILGLVHSKNGKGRLLQRINGFNQAARHSHWVVLVDLDADADCAPPFRSAWLPKPAPNMCFRVAVHEVEAWLLADRERIADFLGVAIARVPADVETLPDPKRALVALASRSRRRDLREDLVPRPRSGRAVGPGYTTRMIEFIETHWRPDVAASSADSLRRCRRSLQRLVENPTA